MANKCSIIPKVRNNKNQIVDSKLFMGLLSYSDNRSEAVKVYLITKNREFLDYWKDKLIFDENDEPTINSLLNNTNIKNIITEDKVLRKLNKKIGNFKNESNDLLLEEDTKENYNKVIDKILFFNRNSEFKDKYVATFKKFYDEKSSKYLLGTRIEKRNKENSSEAKKIAYNYLLNEKLKSLLSEYGISIGALTALEERMGINGVTDFEVAKRSTEGLIELIRLAKGERGEKALPEEFSHFIIKALNDTPLIKRLLNNLNSIAIVKEILGEEFSNYNELYEGNLSKLAEEAAGKLLAKHLLKEEPIIQKPYKNLLERVIEFIKSFFKTISGSSVQKILNEVNNDINSLSNDILSDNLKNPINIKNIATSEKFYQVSERVKRDKELLNNIIANELLRLKIYEERTINSKFTEKQKELINNLLLQLKEDREIEGIFLFLENALEELEKVSIKLASLGENTSYSVSEQASILRDIRNYKYSYQNITKEIREVLRDEENLKDNRYDKKAREAIDKMAVLFEDLEDEYNKKAKPLFMSFLKPFLGENLVVPFGRDKGKTVSVEEIMKRADRDISFFDMWLDSMADSSDYMLKLMDQAVKYNKNEARLDTIEIQKRIESLTLELEQAGIKNTDWMFERDKKGNLSGRYISELNMADFEKNKKELFERLDKKYGDNPIEEDNVAYKREVNIWFNENTEVINNKRYPKKSIYENKVFSNLNATQKHYYNEILEIKAKLDSYLPESVTSLLSTVKIRKDLIERVKNSKNVEDGGKQIWESIKDKFIRRSDDEDFGYRNVIQDFEGHKVESLPIYYTKLKNGESENDISTDVASTLTAYAAMANDYKHMSKIIDVLEIGRTLIRERKVAETQGEDTLISKFTILGKKVEKVLTKQGEDTKISERLNFFFKMQVYGRYMADNGTFGKTKIDKTKVANYVNELTALNTLAFNVLSGISNVATGSIMMKIESFSKEFYSEKNTIKADRIYAKEMPTFLAEIGSRVKTSKLALWAEMFNVMQEYDTDIRNTNFDRKSWYSKMFSKNTLFFMNNAGEHWMQNRTSLALADAYKMKDKSGNIVSLWDALEVVYINPNNKKLGAKLEIKKGYTKEDGSAFTRKDIFKFTRKCAGINQRMHGVYNKEDKSAVQNLALGRMAILFRKWIKPSLNRRFKNATYNFDLEDWTEGYYNTCGRFLFQLAKDIKKSQFDLASRWKELNKTEKANITRALTEVGHFAALSLLLGLISWDDDKDSPWIAKMAEYQARRLYTELGVLIPGKSMISEGLKIIKSPSAGINTAENVLELTKLLNPSSYTEELQSGRYKGHTKAYKYLLESPLFPTNKTIYKAFHPETVIPYYKQ